MRILFLVHRLPYPPDKGDKIRSFWELRTLAENHEVDLFCFYDDQNDKAYVDELHRYCRECYVEPISKFRSRVRALSSVLRGRPLSTAFFFSPTMARRVDEALRSRHYDLILVFSSSMAQYANHWPNLPRVLDLVDVDSDKWAQYSSYSRGPVSWLWKLESRRLLRYESALVHAFSNTLLCTEAEAQLLRSKVPNGKVSVLQNWLDLDYWNPEAVPLSDEMRALQPYIVFTGTMDYFPNVDAVQVFCREVLPKVRSQVPGLNFVIAGRNPSREVLRLGADPAIHVTGVVPDIRPYLRGAAAAVAPMRIARGVQNKILEALAFGIPVVASSPAARALPDDLARLLFIEDEPDPLAARLLTCFQNSNESLAARRRSLASYFETLNLPAQFDFLLRSVVAQTTETCVRGKEKNRQLVSDLG